jgi:hypothetical protein
MKIRNAVRGLILVLICLTISLDTFSQGEKTLRQIRTEPVAIDTSAGHWIFYTGFDSLSIFYKVLHCIEQNGGPTNTFIILRFENNSNEDFTIEWTNRLYGRTNSFPQNPGDSEAFRRIVQRKKTVTEGNCLSSAARICLNNSDLGNLFHITGFQLYNMSIKMVDQLIPGGFH